MQRQESGDLGKVLLEKIGRLFIYLTRTAWTYLRLEWIDHFTDD